MEPVWHLPDSLLNSSSISSFPLDLGILPINRRVLGSLTFTFKSFPSPRSYKSSCGKRREKKGEFIFVKLGMTSSTTPRPHCISPLRTRYEFKKSATSSNVGRVVLYCTVFATLEALQKPKVKKLFFSASSVMARPATGNLFYVQVQIHMPLPTPRTVSGGEKERKAIIHCVIHRLLLSFNARSPV